MSKDKLKEDTCNQFNLEGISIRNKQAKRKTWARYLKLTMEEKIQVTIKYIKRCSTSQEIREMHKKTKTS